MAGDQAAMVWWKLDRLSSRGKPVYLRKYLHHGAVDTAVADQLFSGYKAVLETYATTLNGIHGGLRSRSKNDSVVAHGVGTFVTTRTLKRRGKRPTTGN